MQCNSARRGRMVRRNAVLLAAVAVSVSACSSSSDNGKSSSAKQPSSQAGTATGAKAPTGSALKLEYIGPISTGAVSPQTPAAMKAAAKAINDAGGIQGHPVSVVVCDTRQSAAGEETCAQALGSNGVVGIVAEQGTNSTAVVDASVKNNIANINLSGVGATDLVEASKTSFPISVPADGVLVCPAALVDNGANKIGTIALDVGGGAQLVAGTQAVIANVKGASYTKGAKVAYSDNNLAGPVQTVLNGGSTGAVLALNQPKVISVLNSAAGRLKTCTSDGIATLKDLKGLGKAADGFTVVSGVPPVDLLEEAGGESGKQLLADLTAYYSATKDPAAAPDQINGLSIAGWLGVRAFQQVAEKISGDITRDSVTAQFAKTTDLSFPGLLPEPIDYTKPTVVPTLARLYNSKYKAYSWDSGKGAFQDSSKVYDVISLLTGQK